MRCTRRLFDRHFAASIVVASILASAAATSCSSSEDGEPVRPTEGPDAEADADASPPPQDGPLDASAYDATPFDGGPLPIVCESRPCATSLVTVLTGDKTGEGFCALLDDGSVSCWGTNEDGQLGRGDDAGKVDSALPARVVGLPRIVELDHTCALDESGGIWCWGTGAHFLNDAVTITSERTPVKLALPAATDVAVGDTVGCAVVDDAVLCWGRNWNGQVRGPASGEDLPPERIALPPDAGIRDLVVSTATFVVREDNLVWSWGANPPLARVSSLRPDPHPAPIALGPISSIDVAGASGCATANGIGYCWGTIDFSASPGEAPSPLRRALPEPVVTPERVVQIATTRSTRTSDAARPQRWCAVAVSGAVYCWGLNTSGQAGDGTKDYAYQAVKVQGLPAPAAEVRTMPMSTCALLTSGKIYCWGNNFYGQLGTGTIKGVSLAPKEVMLP